VVKNAYKEVFDVALKKFDHGSVDYLSVIDAQKALLNTKLSISQINAQILMADVMLYKAFGGGWSYEQKREEILKKKEKNNDE